MLRFATYRADQWLAPRTAVQRADFFVIHSVVAAVRDGIRPQP